MNNPLSEIAFDLYRAIEDYVYNVDSAETFLSKMENLGLGEPERNIIHSLLSEKM